MWPFIVLALVWFVAIVIGGRYSLLAIANAGVAWERQRVAKMASNGYVCPTCGRPR
jgi:hypothetical protein